MKHSHPAFDNLRLAVEALATGAGSIHSRLQAAEPYFGKAFESKMQTRLQQQLRLSIGAGIVECGPEDNDYSVAESIALLDEARAVKIASDILRLYELAAGLREDS